MRGRFGYRRLHTLLMREGMTMNHKKLRRLYREERLQVRHRGGCKRAIGMRAPIAVPQAPNQRWSLDSMSDAFFDGRRFRILAVLDDFSGNAWRSSPTRRCPACGSCASSTASSPDAVARHCACPTTVRN